jgi:hypothetical protein
LAEFDPTPPEATLSQCNPASRNGTSAGLGSIGPPASVTGDVGALEQLSDNAYSYVGTSNVPNWTPGTSGNWTWNFTGSP